MARRLSTALRPASTPRQELTRAGRRVTRSGGRLIVVMGLVVRIVPAAKRTEGMTWAITKLYLLATPGDAPPTGRLLHDRPPTADQFEAVPPTVLVEPAFAAD